MDISNSRLFSTARSSTENYCDSETGRTLFELEFQTTFNTVSRGQVPGIRFHCSLGAVQSDPDQRISVVSPVVYLLERLQNRWLQIRFYMPRKQCGRYSRQKRLFSMRNPVK